MTFKCLSDIIIVEPDEKETQVGSILLAESAQEEAKQGTVIAVGPGRAYERYIEPMELKPGDKVLFSMYAKEKFKYRGKTLLTMHQVDIIGVLT